MPFLSTSLKVKLLLLAAIFPVAFSLIGWFLSSFYQNTESRVIFAALGFVLGIFFSFICFRRKLFTVVLYQAPIPLALFLLAWWFSHVFTSGWLAFLIGALWFFIGLWLNSELVLPYQFYRIKKRFLALIYLFFSIAMLGFFMGIPVFNLLLGVLAGNYLSIRVLYPYSSKTTIQKNLVQGAWFTALSLLGITLFAGIIAVSDLENSLLMAQQLLQIQLSKNLFLLLLALGAVILTLFQFALTLFSARTMLNWWHYRRKKLMKERMNRLAQAFDSSSSPV
ncbi:MAG: hypothetical protein AB7S69_16270 [Salinivirgaceae bacterium]